MLMGSVLGALGGMACDASIDPIAVPEGCPQKPIRGPEEYVNERSERLIDDFEDGNDQLARVSNRNGSWIPVTNISSDRFMAGASSACAARGNFAGHLVGAGFTERGANWSGVFEAYDSTPVGPAAVPFDGSAYSGISFWAAIGPTVAEPFIEGVGLTTMDNAWNGGICVTGCMDYYATKLVFTRTWQRFVIRFADLKQGGFGSPQLAIRLDQLVGFIIWPKNDFDIWIDDVRFEP